MSGCSYWGTCPVCNNGKMNCYTDYKPFDNVSGECLGCGFVYFTQADRMSLEEINEQRQDFEQPKLTQKEYDKFTKEDFNI